jgi:hypothetical protein
MTPTTGRAVNLVFTSNVRGVTITSDEMTPISIPETLAASIGDTYANLTAQHRRLRTDPPQRFDSWQRVEGYDEDGSARWVGLSRSPSLGLSLTDDITVRNPVTGELEVAIQAHFIPALRVKAMDLRVRSDR